MLRGCLDRRGAVDAPQLAGAAPVMLQGCLDRRASGSVDAPESAGRRW